MLNGQTALKHLMLNGKRNRTTILILTIKTLFDFQDQCMSVPIRFEVQTYLEY